METPAQIEHELADRPLIITALSLGLDLLKDGDARGLDLLEDLLERLKIDDAVELRFHQLSNGATVEQLWN